MAIRIKSKKNAADLFEKVEATSNISAALERAIGTAKEVKDKYSSSSTTYGRCHESHPVIALGKGEIVGASCSSPRKGFDIYIGFDWSMQFHAPYPWDKTKYKPVIDVHFKITDHSAPSDVENFKLMIDWMQEQLEKGKRIHIGCIGGHGRTGLVLAALVKQMLGIEDAITWVREQHCQKAVESHTQVEFLHKHYGITKQKPSKGGSIGANDGWVGKTGYHRQKQFEKDNGFSDPNWDEDGNYIGKPLGTSTASSPAGFTDDRRDGSPRRGDTVSHCEGKGGIF